MTPTLKTAISLGVAAAVFAGAVAAAVLFVNVGVPPASKTTPVAPLPGTPEIDLLALVVPPLDAVKGTWTFENSRLICEDGFGTQLEIPYLLPEEYSFTLEFVRRSGTGPVFLILPQAGKPIVRRLGGEDGGLESGRIHVATVEVRKDRTTVWFNNGKLADGTGDGSLWRPRRDGVAGLASPESVTEFRKIRLFERSGRGRPLRPK